MAEKNRAHGKIDGLPPEVREGVEQQLMTGETYGAIAEGLKEKFQQCRTLWQEVSEEV